MDTTIIKRVLLTEKGQDLALQNRYQVEVALSATKPQIREAAEKKFGVHVLAVRTAVVKGKTHAVRGTRRLRTDSDWKRAIITVRAGERIETV